MSEIYEKFDTDLLRSFVFARSVAVDLENNEITSDTLMIGIILSGPNVATEILKITNIKLPTLLQKIKERASLKKNNASECVYNDIKVSQEIKTLLKSAIKIKNDLEDKVLGVQHVLIALCLNKYFDGMVDLDKEKVKKALLQVLIVGDGDEDEDFDNEDDDDLCDVLSNGKHSKKDSKKSKKEIINLYFIDLTQNAIDGKLDPVIGRDNEIEQVISILCRKRKNNPVLIGAAGVGKTAIVEGLAQRIASGVVPTALKDKKIMMLNLSSVVADTQYRGQFEEKMNRILKLFKENKNYVCFVDEMHTMLGAGNSTNSLDAGNILKPALARGDFKCIGATTEDEYYKFVSKDSALERRFQKVKVPEPTTEETKKILYGIKESMEKHHNCIVSNDAIDAAVDLAELYVRDKHFPDKSIDLIDDACARLVNSKKGSTNIVGKEHIAKVVSDQQGIPYDTIISTYADKILKLEENIKKDFVGQSESLKSVCRTIKNAYVGIRSMDAPICSFVFAGPSGTGKTFLAEKIADSIFHQKDAFVRINMTEFTEPHSVSRLVGSPPGYVGFGDKNQLTDLVLRRPYCLILLDEIEKSHPDIMKIFMQILSRGFLTDAKGREVSFRQSIVIMTTNIGSESSTQSSLGFSSTNTVQNEKRDKVVSLCKKMFGVEFLNRVNSFVTFDNFSDKELEEIAKVFLVKMGDNIKKHKQITLSYDENIIPIIVKEAKKLHGVNANPIEDVVMKNYVPSVISDFLLTSQSNSGNIKLVLEKDKIVAK